MKTYKLKPFICFLISSTIVSCSTIPVGPGVTSSPVIQPTGTTPSIEITTQLTPTLTSEPKTPTDPTLTPTQVTGNGQDDPFPISGTIAMESGLDDGVDIYTLDLSCLEKSGGCDEALTQLVDHVNRDRFPLWSPDGSQILFLSDRAGVYLSFDLYLMNPDGTDVRRLTYAPLSKDQPSWSPKGDTIAYVARQDQAGSIYTYHLEERKVRPLPELRDWNMWPSWSPDGQKIAFVSYDNGFNKPKDLCVMDIDEDSIECLTNDAYVSEEAPSWSPDGESIVVAMKEDDVHSIYRIEVQTGSLTRLTDGQRSATSPSWSPDGSEIVYMVYIGDPLLNFDIFVMNTDGSQKARITQNPGQDSIPIWSRNGKFIVFTTLREEGIQVQIASSSGTWVKTLTSTYLDLIAYSLFEGSEAE